NGHPAHNHKPNFYITALSRYCVMANRAKKSYSSLLNICSIVRYLAAAPCGCGNSHGAPNQSSLARSPEVSLSLAGRNNIARMESRSVVCVKSGLMDLRHRVRQAIGNAALEGLGTPEFLPLERGADPARGALPIDDKGRQRRGDWSGRARRNAPRR